ncbi:hypothetical protein LguiA_005375 [Lonicera macranthoides]
MNATIDTLRDVTHFMSIYPPSFNIFGQMRELIVFCFITKSELLFQRLKQFEPFDLRPPVYDYLPSLSMKSKKDDNGEADALVHFKSFEVEINRNSIILKMEDSSCKFLNIRNYICLSKAIDSCEIINVLFERNMSTHSLPLVEGSCPSLFDVLAHIGAGLDKFRASDSVQAAIRNRIGGFYEKPDKNMHRVRVRVPVMVAQVLKQEPGLISLAVEGFYDRDIDTMKYAAKMERFLPNGSGEEVVETSVVMSRAMYAQLMQQTFQAPKCYPMPQRSEGKEYVEAELGMKIACGFEMIYQLRKREGVEGKGSTWEAFRETLEKSGYFEGLLPGSKEYKRLMENAEEYYNKSSLHSRASEMMSAPVKRIDEILALPYSADDFKGRELPPSDDDSWLYNGEDELNAALLERQKEMELYNSKHKKKQKSNEQQDAGPSSGADLNDHGLGNIAKSMQAFVHKMSSYEGAEIPENRNEEAIDFDVDRFMKDMESVMKFPGSEEAGNDEDIEEGSSSDMDFDESEGDSDIDKPVEAKEEGGEVFMLSYSDALSKELKTTTLNKSFVRANEQPPAKKDEGTSKELDVEMDEEEEFSPVDVDVNLVKSFLDSFSSQEGLPGPASNLLGLMGLQLPQDSNKHKK